MSEQPGAPARAGLGLWPSVALFSGAVCIATAPIFVRLAETGPLSTAFWRVVLSLPIAWLWWGCARRGRDPRPPVPRRSAAILVWTGLFFAADLGIWHVSLMLTSVANSTLLVNTAPFFVTLGAWWLFGQRARPLFWAAMILAFVGASLLVNASLARSPAQLAGDAVAVLAAVCYAGYLLSAAKARISWPTVSVMTVSATVTAAALLPVALLSGERFLPASASGWLPLAGLAIVAQLGGQSLITYALAHLPASYSSVGLLVQPVLAAIFAWLILAEPVGPAQALGGLIVLAGIALARRAQS